MNIQRQYSNKIVQSMYKICHRLIFVLIIHCTLSIIHSANAQTVVNCVELYSMDETDPNSTGNNGLATEDDYACISFCKGGTVKVNTVEVYSMDETDPNSTGNNGLANEDDYASVNIVTCATACTPFSIINASANPSSFATGNASDLNVLGGGITAGTTTFIWAGSAGTPSFTSSIQAPNTNAINTAGGYSYTVTVTNANGTGVCTATATTSLTVTCLTLTGSLADETICAGQAANPLVVSTNATAANSVRFVYLTSHSNDAATIYASTNILATVTPSSGIATFTPTAASFPNNTASPITYHTYAIFNPDPSDASCRAFVHVHINVNPIPAVLAGVSSSPICSGTNASLTSSGGGTYLWAGSSGTFSSNTAQNPTVSGLALGNHTFTVSVTNAGCTASATTSVQVQTCSNPCTVLSNLVAAATPSSFVAGGTTNLDVTGTGIIAGTTFIWTAPSGGGGFSNASIQNPNLTPPATIGTYTYTVVASNANGTGICTASATVSVQVLPVVQPRCTAISDLIATAIPNNLTLGDNTDLDVNGTGLAGSTTFNWVASAGSPTFSTNIQNPSINNFSTAGGYSYTVTATNVNGTGTCTATATTSLTVSVTIVAPTCSVAIVSITPSTCDRWSNKYTVAVRVSYSMSVLNNITINGQSFTPAGLSGTETFTLARITSDGATNVPVDVSITSSGGMACFSNGAYNAPDPCTPIWVDPVGYIYCQQTGQIITGGTVSVTGPPGAVINLVENGSTGRYAFLIDGTPGLYTITYTPPVGYSISTTCLPQAGAYTPPISAIPVELGSDIVFAGSYAESALISASCASNPYYTTFNLDPNSPLILQNNIPVTCPCPTVTATASPVTCNGNVSNNDAKITITNVDNATHYRYVQGSTYTGGGYVGATPLPAGTTDIVTGLANPTVPTPYTIRVFHDNECYQDFSVLLQPRVCTCPPAACLEIISVRIR